MVRLVCLERTACAIIVEHPPLRNQRLYVPPAGRDVVVRKRVCV
jgi:hypothetical protein